MHPTWPLTDSTIPLGNLHLNSLSELRRVDLGELQLVPDPKSPLPLPSRSSSDAEAAHSDSAKRAIGITPFVDPRCEMFQEFEEKDASPSPLSYIDSMASYNIQVCYYPM